MKRLLPLVFLLSALVASALAQRHGRSDAEFVIEFGKVKQPDGTWKSVRGMRLPVEIEPMQGEVSNARGRRFLSDNMDVAAYSNDNGDSSYFRSDEEFPMPSALDDIVTNTAGQGGVWQRFTIGLWIPDRTKVLLRFQVFDSFVSGRGAGVSAFSGLIADFGGYLQANDTTTFPVIPWNYKVTINGVSILGISVPDGEFYFAQQIREPHLVGFPPQEDGEGAFRTDWFMLFSGGGPSIGSSQDIFWYDWDPAPNGIYDETEADYFGGPPNHANFLFRLEVGGTQQELLPFSVTLVSGTYLSGTFADLWYSDDTYYRAQHISPFSTRFPIQMEVESSSPVQNITAMRVTVEGSAIAAGIERVVSAYNFTTNQWVELSRVLEQTTDRTVESYVLSNPAQFVRAGDRRVRAQVKYRENTGEINPPWWIRVDRLTWTITRP